MSQYSGDRVAQFGHARREHARRAAAFEGNHDGSPSADAFRRVSSQAVELLTEAKRLPTSDRAGELVAWLEKIVAADGAMLSSWEGWDGELERVATLWREAYTARQEADVAWARGSLDPDEAARLHAETVRTRAVFFAREVELDAAQKPVPVPAPELDVEAVRLARVHTEELAEHFAAHGVEFRDDAPRPALDVVSLAKSQAREASPHEARAWVLFEHRALAEVRKTKAADLERLFSLRTKAHAEVVRYGAHAR